jgi:hypothetical protein
MNKIDKPSDFPLPLASQLRDACQTIAGSPPQKDHLTRRLQLTSDLLAEAKSLPPAPLLLWREPATKAIHHAPVGQNLVVGRQPERGGLKLAEDKHLSRSHFMVREAADEYWLEDLKSHNGTAVNRAENRVDNQRLHDGDLILAGNHIFVFLRQEKTI